VQTAGELYAHLTRRRYCAVKDRDALRVLSRLAVVVTTPSHLVSDLLEQLYARNSRTAAPGIICAADPEGLRKQVLTRAASALLCGPASFPWIDFHPLVALNSMIFDDREIYGGKATERDVLAALGKGAGVLTVVTHSDGIDAMILPTLSLCPLVEHRSGGDP